MDTTYTSRDTLQAAGAEFISGEQEFALIQGDSNFLDVYQIGPDGQAERRGGASRRDGALRIIDDIVSGREQERVDAHFRFIDESERNVAPEVAVLVEKAGLRVTHTGGGCLAWEKMLDEASEDYVMITNGDLGIDGDVAEEVWNICRYRGDAWVGIGDVSLRDAIAAIGLLPEPSADDERMLDAKTILRDMPIIDPSTGTMR